MGVTWGQSAVAAGAFDAQTAVERLESEMADMRIDICELKQSTLVIADIQRNMVTVSALDALMQKYLAPHSSPTSTIQVMQTEGNPPIHDPQSSTHGTVPSSTPVVWSSAAPVLESVIKNATHGQAVGYTAVMTDSIHCSTTRSLDPNTQSNGLNVPVHFQIPPISQPLPQTFEQQIHPPHPGIWPQVQPGQQQQCVPPNYNPVTGQFLPIPDAQNKQQFSQNFRVQPAESDRNERIQQLGGISYYADAVLKGPRLEIPLFAGEDPIGWLQQCKKFFDMSGTPYEQWVNIATCHFYGGANVWLKNICVPWQMVNWQQFCQMIADKFTQANAHEAVERLKNIQQHSSVQVYIDNFKECVQLVRRDHPYLQEAFLMSCFIGGLRAVIKHDVCGQRLRGILEDYWYAKVYENSAAAKKSYYQSFPPRHRGHAPQTNFKFSPKQLQIPTTDIPHQTTQTRTNPLGNVGIARNLGTENIAADRGEHYI